MIHLVLVFIYIYNWSLQSPEHNRHSTPGTLVQMNLAMGRFVRFLVLPFNVQQLGHSSTRICVLVVLCNSLSTRSTARSIIRSTRVYCFSLQYQHIFVSFTALLFIAMNDALYLNAVFSILNFFLST